MSFPAPPAAERAWLTRGLQLEMAMAGEHMRSPDALEGLRAFAEKRKPRFA